MQAYVEEGFHEEMQVHIEELAALSRVDGAGQPYLIRRLSDPRFLISKSGFYWEVQREGFKPVKAPSIVSGDLSGSLAKATKPKWAITDGPTGRSLEYGMIRATSSGGPPLRLSIGSDMKVIEDTINTFEWPLFWSLFIFASVMIIVGTLQVKFGLRPLDRLAQSIGAIRNGRASRMQGDYPTEIQPLVSDLNSLLDGNAELVKRARLQAGNLAHGLRTPLAIILDEAEQLREMGKEEAANTLVHECDRMHRQINYHLARARTAAAQPVPGKVASLRETLDPIIRAMRRLHADRSITLCCGDFPDVIVACDDVDLGEMLSNLIDNAFKWARSKVIISWLCIEDCVEIKVDDDGKGIEEVDIEAAFSAGDRLDDVTPGTGLGLAIVRELSTLYRGQISLTKSPLGGLQAVLRLPRVARS